MKKLMLLLAGAGTMAFASCNKTEKTESDTATVTENTTTAPTADPEAMYRDRASDVTRQMAKDLQFDADTGMQRKVSTVYYTRAKRRNEARGKYTTDTTGMYKTLREIDLETDREFKSLLKPEQYETYEARRTTYYGGFEETDARPDSMGSTSASASQSAMDNAAGGTHSPNAKIKTKTEKDGDTKTKIEDGDNETKIKTEDGVTKVKSKAKDN